MSTFSGGRGGRESSIQGPKQEQESSSGFGFAFNQRPETPTPITPTHSFGTPHISTSVPEHASDIPTSAPPTQGSLCPPFKEFQESDQTIPTAHVMLFYQSISCMVSYRQLSCEEIRVQDYEQGRRPLITNCAGFNHSSQVSPQLGSSAPSVMSFIQQPTVQSSPFGQSPSGRTVAFASPNTSVSLSASLLGSKALEECNPDATAETPGTAILEHLNSEDSQNEKHQSSTWMQVASTFNLVASFGRRQFKRFSYTRCFLPPSFQEYIMVNGAEWLDVYQDREEQNENSRLRLIDAWHVPVCGLFLGRLIDRPEFRLSKTEYISGAEVEHQVYMFEGIILLVVEMKVTPQRSELDNIAQVLLELASAYHLNGKKALFEKQPAVFGLLTDLKTFQLYSFNGENFLQAQEIFVSSQSRLEFLHGMVLVTDMLFSLLLEGYILNLRAVISHSKDSTDATFSVTSQSAQSQRVLGLRPSREEYAHALVKAEESQKALQERNRTSRKTAEMQGKRGLELLAESVKSLPKYRHVTEDLDEKRMEDVAKSFFDNMFDAP